MIFLLFSLSCTSNRVETKSKNIAENKERAVHSNYKNWDNISFNTNVKDKFEEEQEKKREKLKSDKEFYKNDKEYGIVDLYEKIKKDITGSDKKEKAKDEAKVKEKNRVRRKTDKNSI